MGQVTLSGNAIDIFGTLEGATTYWATTVRGANWAASSQTLRQQALVEATRWILRVGVCGTDGTELSPSLADTNVPTEVQEGTYELAEAVLGNAEASNTANTGQNIKVAGAGSARVEFFRPTAGSVFPVAAQRLLGPFLKSQIATSNTGAFAPGSTAGSGGDVSVFEDAQLGFGLNEGGYP